MRFVRRLFRLAAIALVLLATVAGAAAWYVREHADELLLTQVRAAVERSLPGVDVAVGSARFDWHDRFTLGDLAITDDAGGPVLIAPEVVVEIDRDRLLGTREFTIRRVTLVGPEVELARAVDGTWRIESLLARLPSGGGKPPEIAVTDGTLALVLERPGADPVRVGLADITLAVRPDGDRGLKLAASTAVEAGPRIEAEGAIDLARWTWSVRGRAEGVDTSGPLVSLVTAYDPAASRRFVALAAGVTGAAPSRPIRTVSLEDDSFGGEPAAQAKPPLGVSLEADVDFAVSLPDPAGEILFDVTGDARAGRIEHAALPLPLEGVAGRVRVTNDGLTVSDLVGNHGDARLAVDGAMSFRSASAPEIVPASSEEAGPAARPDRFDVTLREVALTPEVIALLPGGTGEVTRGLDPTGVVDVALRVSPREATGGWDLEAFRLVTTGATLRPRPFPLPVTDVSGEIKLVDRDRLEVTAKGLADGYPIDCVGTVIRRGDGPGEVESAVRVTAAAATLTPAAVAACPPTARQIFRTLGLSAAGAIEVAFYRPPVSMAPLQWTLTTDVTDAVVRHEAFPYELRDVTGRVTFDAVSGDWNFEDLRGRHGEVVVTGGGLCRGGDGHALEIRLDVADAPLDRDLFAACTDELKAAWRHLRPTGTISGPVDIAWRTGEPTAIALPALSWTGGTLNSVGFPYLIERIDAGLAYADGVVTIDRFAGRHGETTIAGTGRCVVGAGEEWEFRIGRLDVDGLRADADLRRAVGPALREFLIAANPRGPLAVDGAIALRGRPDTPAVAAAWDLATRFRGADWTVGLEATDTAGVVRCRGTFDGTDARFDGLIDLDHATILEQRAVNVTGPFRYRSGKLVVGSPRVFGLAAGGTAGIPPAERLTGELIGGAWTVDALVEPAAAGKRYALRSTLAGGRLQDYTSLTGVDTLRGVVNGWIDLRGAVPAVTVAGGPAATIDGRGQLEISPAALWELPVLVETLKVLNLRPADRTAFHFAFADFRIDDDGFKFDTIDLVGDAISMRGRGVAGWDETLDLFLYSFAPQQRFTVPVIGQLWNRATAGWVGVEVRGTVTNPTQRVIGAPVLNDAVRGFLDSFDPTRREPPTLDLEGLRFAAPAEANRRGGRGWSGGVK